MKYEGIIIYLNEWLLYNSSIEFRKQLDCTLESSKNAFLLYSLQSMEKSVCRISDYIEKSKPHTAHSPEHHRLRSPYARMGPNPEYYSVECLF